MSDISDVLKLAEAINAKKEGDKGFQELLTEISTFLAEILAALEKPKAELAAGSDQSSEADAMGQVVRQALGEGLASLSSSLATLRIPAPVFNAQPGWNTLKVTFEMASNGFITGATIKRS